LLQGESSQNNRRRSRRHFCGQGFDDNTAAYGIGFDGRFHRIPIDQGKRGLCVIQGDPRAATRLGWTNYFATTDHEACWRQAWWTRPFFIAIHCQQVTVFARNEAYGAHIQSAIG